MYTAQERLLRFAVCLGAERLSPFERKYFSSISFAFVKFDLDSQVAS
jgi:hypothetical protein